MDVFFAAWALRVSRTVLGGGNGTFQGAMAAAERFSSLAVVRQDKPVIPEESFEEVQVREDGPRPGMKDGHLAPC